MFTPPILASFHLLSHLFPTVSSKWLGIRYKAFTRISPSVYATQSNVSILSPIVSLLQCQAGGRGKDTRLSIIYPIVFTPPSPASLFILSLSISNRKQRCGTLHTQPTQPLTFFPSPLPLSQPSGLGITQAGDKAQDTHPYLLLHLFFTLATPKRIVEADVVVVCLWCD